MSSRNASVAAGHTISRHTFTKGVVVVAVVLLLIFLSMKTISLHETATAYRRHVAELEQDIADEEDRSEDLEEQSIYIQTLQYIEEIARERLGLVYPDEVVLVPED